jgi:hypothetical protein
MRSRHVCSLLLFAACADTSARPEIEMPYPALLGGELDGPVDKSRSPACRRGGFRDFDFWLGQWVITQPDGSPGGVSAITSELAGCAVMETYQGGGGRSLNLYDRLRDRWTQTYIDRGGLLGRLHGRLEGVAMVMSSDVRTTPTGLELTSQLTWTPRADGGVQQLWMQSTDGGATYAVAFDGNYQPGTFVPPVVLPSPACNVTFPAFRGADFLLGSWIVETERGLRLGRTELRSTAGGCLIEEDFEGPLGYSARAFITYDRLTRTWYRIQGDTVGFVYELAGGAAGTALTMSGEVLPGVTAQLVWSAVGNRLRQQWQVSVGGTPLATGALIYRRATAP